MKQTLGFIVKTIKLGKAHSFFFFFFNYKPVPWTVVGLDCSIYGMKVPASLKTFNIFSWSLAA